MHGPLNAAVARTPQAVSKPVQDVTSTVALRLPPTETKACGRKELPAVISFQTKEIVFLL